MSAMTDDYAKVGKKKKRKSTRSRRYIYTIGDDYPGIVAGHKECFGATRGFRGVPPNMGWLWNFAEPRKGWRPGALGKSVLKLMKLKLALPSTANTSPGRSSRRKKVVKQEGQPSDFPSEAEDEPIEQKAALQVKREGDIITVIVHPLKEVEELEDGEDPFMNCDPIIFKIVQQPTPKRAAKRLARERKKYEEEIKKSLELALEEICQCAYEDVYCTDMNAIDRVIQKVPSFSEEPTCNCDEDSSDSGDSDWDIEYTPPFAMTGLRPRKPTKVHVETQYLENDCARKVKMTSTKGVSMSEASGGINASRSATRLR